MHFVTTAFVTIGDVNASSLVNNAKVKSSWRQLTDTAILTMPKVLYKEGLTPIKQGDRVEIALGYEGYTRDVFQGFVTHINPKIPLEVKCEDASWLLKRVNLKKTWTTKVKLTDIIKYTVDETNKVNPDYQIILSKNIPEIEFTKFRLNNVNGAQVMQKLKDKYGLTAYFRDLDLHVNLPYQEQTENVKIDLGSNVIKHNLEYLTKETQVLKIKAVSILKDNQTLKAEVGNEGGDVITRFYYNIDNVVTLKKLANDDLDKLKYEGYRGKVTTFFLPFSSHSSIAEVTDSDFDQVSSHFVDEVVYTLDTGITIEATLGIKV